MWEPIRSVVRKAAVAAATAVTHIGEPRSEADKAEERPFGQRVRQAGVDAAARLALGVGAQSMLRSVARLLPRTGVGRAAGSVAARPLASVGIVLFIYDAAKDAFRLGRGRLTAQEYVERSSGNAAGLVTSASGAVVGGAVGSVALPIVGGAVGSFVGGVVGGIGGDVLGRKIAQRYVIQRAPDAGRSRPREP